MSHGTRSPVGPAQVREFRLDDPLTHAESRGDLLCSRLAEVGALQPGPVLDLGCGYGGISLALRRRGHDVYSLDKELSNITVVRGRLRDAGAPALATNASATALPFRSNMFRTVLMVGVLEWVGFSDDARNPRSLQTETLREVCRVLAPGGRLVLATKNRLFPRFAWSDAQLGLPLVNLLPRRVADRAVRMVRGYGYQSRIYSARGWHRILGDAGFRVEGSWTPRYTYQYPLTMLPFSGRGSTGSVAEERVRQLSQSEQREATRSAAQAARSRYYDMIEATGLHRHLAAGFIFSATPSGDASAQSRQV